MTPDIDELERLGKAASQGPWELGVDAGTITSEHVGYVVSADVLTPNDAAFIVALRNNLQPMIDEIRQLRVPTCISCGAQDDLEFGPDPYASEINHNDTDVWECKGCRRESATDI